MFKVKHIRVCDVSPYLRHTMQHIIIKDSKNNHIVWDGSTVTRPTDIVMNQVTPVAQEAPVMFGHVKSQIYTDIYNTCISHPTATILLGLADIKACLVRSKISLSVLTYSTVCNQSVSTYVLDSLSVLTLATGI